MRGILNYFTSTEKIHVHYRYSSSLLLFALIAGITLSTQAQQYPTGPLRIIVPYPPGASNDVLGRHLAQKLGPAVGQNVIVENRAGASGAIGADFVAKSAPNGYTLMFTSSSFATNAAAGIKMQFDPERAFAPVGVFGISPVLLLIHPELPVKSVRELIALTKARPGQINFSSSGNGSINHLSGESFKNAAKIDIVHVPYKGMVPALTDLVAGQVQIVFTTFSSMGPLANSGRVRLLAVASAKPSPFAPGLPTVAESGLPGYESEIWWASLRRRIHRARSLIVSIAKCAPRCKPPTYAKSSHAKAPTPHRPRPMSSAPCCNRPSPNGARSSVTARSSSTDELRSRAELGEYRVHS